MERFMANSKISATRLKKIAYHSILEGAELHSEFLQNSVKNLSKDMHQFRNKHYNW